MISPGKQQSLARDVLFVDLDGTLVATDILCESLLRAVKQGPRVIAEIVLGAYRGRANLKRVVAERVALDPQRLPYREDVFAFLRKEKAYGRTVVLATAGDEIWAQGVAKQLGIFDDVLASDGQHNLKGQFKLAAIEAYCQQHKFQEFAYVGDAPADLPIWQRATQVYVVEPSGSLLRALKKIGEPVHILGRRQSRLKAIFRALRPQQWVKNLLLFVPWLLAHEILEVNKFLSLLLAFFTFSACASAVYLINDLVDLEADRLHPTKRKRPFASGALPVVAGPPIAVGLLLFSGLLSVATLPWAFVGTLALYLIVTTSYSFWLKRKVMIDVLTLAGLYTLRIFAGGAAVNVPVSEWLSAFSMFFFISLAFAKRYAELARLGDEGSTYSEGRGYQVTDLSLVENMGPTSGYLAVLVFALYINSDAMKQLYANTWVLWLICPLLLYWLGRLWFLAKRRELSEDPVVFAIKDRISLLVGAVAAVLLVVATYWR